VNDKKLVRTAGRYTYVKNPCCGAEHWCTQPMKANTAQVIPDLVKALTAIVNMYESNQPDICLDLRMTNIARAAIERYVKAME
jgi:hypothetical protein